MVFSLPFSSKDEGLYKHLSFISSRVPQEEEGLQCGIECEKFYMGNYYRKRSAFVKQVLNYGHFLLFCTGPWIDMAANVC
jgi:hypothetical protein